MDIELKKRFVGPNLYSALPVLLFRVTGTKKMPARTLYAPGAATLLELLPELATKCGVSKFFTSTQSDRSLGLGHAIEHIAVALQSRAGSEVVCARRTGGPGIGKRSAVVPYEDARVAEAAAQLACEMAERIIVTHDFPVEEAGSLLNDARQEIVTAFARPIEAFLKLAGRRSLPVQDRAFVRAAMARDVPIRRVVGRMLQLGQGKHQQRVSATKTTRTNVVSNDIAANKDFARRFLLELGLPIPRYERVYRQKDALEAADRIGYPVVVKPNQGNMGKAVSVGMRNRREVRAAYKRAREIDRSVLIEEVIEGEDFRVLVIDGQFVAASKRTPGHVVGDGESSVEQLVDVLNQDPRRGRGPSSPWTRLEIDEQAERLLSDRKMTRTSVPEKDEVLFLRKNANTSDGGTAIDVTDDVHPDNREIAVRAARSIGLDIAGVDFLTKDIGRSMWRTGGRICEINSRPGLRKHMWPANGPPRDIMTPIVDMLYPRGRAGRIPIVAILGVKRSAARRIARQLEYILARERHHVGLAVDRRVYIDGRKIRSRNRAAPEAAQMILMDPDVDIAVLEMTVNDVVREGLGCDAFDLLLVVDQAEEAEEAEEQATPTQETEPAETSAAEISGKLRDAIRVVSQTTRGEILTRGNSRLNDVVTEYAGKSPIVAISTVPTVLDSQAPDLAEASPEDHFAWCAATRLGVDETRARESINRYAVKRDKKKRKSKSESRKEPATVPISEGSVQEETQAIAVVASSADVEVEV